MALPQAELRLQRGDRMHGMRLADRRGRRLGQAEVLDLASLHQLCHRAYRVFDGRVWIDAVLIVEVDVVQAKPLQRCIAGLLYILGLAAQTPVIGPGPVAKVGELRCKKNFIAT